MQERIAKLKKLRGKSVKEICARGAEELSKLAERFFGSGVAEMSDSALLGQICTSSRDGSAQGTALLIAKRFRGDSQPLLPSLAHRDEVISLMNTRFPKERSALIDSAERAIRGRFDLLGLTDISFGEQIDWHLEPTSGKRTPLDHWSKIDYLDPDVAGDKKVTWELNRHGHFVTLGQAYWLTGDERYAESFVSQATSWMDRNPPKRGINWASSLELAFRTVAWVWAMHLFAGSAHLTPSFTLRLLKYMVAQGRHIESYLSTYFSPNTHLTGEALGLFYLGASLPELSRADGWRETGLKILLEQLPLQVRADGVYFEQTTYYHRYTTDFYMHLLVLARSRQVDLPAGVERGLERLIDHLMWITRPDGTSPLLGDDDGGRLISFASRRGNDFRDTLATGAALFGRADWKYVASDAAVETLWLLGPEGLKRYDEIAPSPPPGRARAFTDGGYFVLRDGWSKSASYAVIDCGPHGSGSGGHAHADALALEFAAQGKNWLIDPGTFTYTADPKLRDLFRATQAHNTITVDDQPQSLPAGPFSWRHTARTSLTEFITGDCFKYFEGSHDGYERLADPVTHARSLLFLDSDPSKELPAYLILSDKFNARGDHRYSMRYHFPPGCSANASGNRVEAEQGGDKLDISAYGQAGLSARISDGWASERYKQREPARVAVFEAEGHGPRQFTSVILPQPRGAPTTNIRSREQAEVFHIAAGEVEDIAIIGAIRGDGQAELGSDLLGSDLLGSDLLRARGHMAWGRFARGEFEKALLIRGDLIEAAGKIALSSPAIIRHCFIQVSEGRVVISIDGASRFDMVLNVPRARVLINNQSFDMKPGRRGAAFVLDGQAWQLIERD